MIILIIDKSEKKIIKSRGDHDPKQQRKDDREG